MAHDTLGHTTDGRPLHRAGSVATHYYEIHPDLLGQSDDLGIGLSGSQVCLFYVYTLSPEFLGLPLQKATRSLIVLLEDGKSVALALSIA